MPNLDPLVAAVLRQHEKVQRRLRETTADVKAVVETALAEDRISPEQAEAILGQLPKES